MNKLSSFLITIAILSIYFIVFSYLKLNSTIGFGFKLGEINLIETFLRPFLLGLFTIIGILSKIAFDMIEKADEKKFNILEIIKKTINSKNAWIAIIVCPVIIISFFSSIQEIESNPLVSLMAYQNGFFFNSILNKGNEKE